MFIGVVLLIAAAAAIALLIRSQGKFRDMTERVILVVREGEIAVEDIPRRYSERWPKRKLSKRQLLQAVIALLRDGLLTLLAGENRRYVKMSDIKRGCPPNELEWLLKTRATLSWAGQKFSAERAEG